MKTKVLVVMYQSSDGYGTPTLQEKIDKTISALGDGWEVRSAQTTTSAHGGVSARDTCLHKPEFSYVTTIIMEKKVA